MSANRRIFLGRCGTAGAISVGVSLPGIWRGAIRAAGNQAKPGGRVLVVVEMAGGNDGLNTVIPFTDDAYHKARPTLAVGKDRVLKVTGQVGLHPRLAEIRALFDDGQVAVVQGVGYPRPDRSHFRSMDIWHTARPEKVDLRDGWLGRALELDPRALGGGVPALALGTEKLPLALLSSRVNVPNVQSMDAYKLVAGPGDSSTQARSRQTLREAVALHGASGSEGGAASELDFLRRTADVTLTSVDRLSEVAKAYKPGATYPGTGLAQRLQVVAQLIAGNLGTQIFYVSLGGFDTHSRQQPAHEGLLGELSGAVGAFLKDLKSHGLADRVMVATFSEFGRRLAENGSLGTDHGAASQMFCIGAGARGGVLGAHPSLTDLVDGDPKHHTDFRQVYAALLEKWLGYPSEPVLGKGFKPVDCVKV
ncbi:MAG: DUF1501 domain-containing protein [Planctomycetota bacterium]|nr:DUF1501 domain-containing protein [Planctomycetota bacterium]